MEYTQEQNDTIQLLNNILQEEDIELWGEEKDINLDELLAPKSEEEMQHLVNAFIIKRQIGW